MASSSLRAKATSLQWLVALGPSRSLHTASGPLHWLTYPLPGCSPPALRIADPRPFPPDVHSSITLSKIPSLTPYSSLAHLSPRNLLLSGLPRDLPSLLAASPRAEVSSCYFTTSVWGCAGCRVTFSHRVRVVFLQPLSQPTLPFCLSFLLPVLLLT